MIEVWDLWFPDAGATGISFARSQVDSEAAGNRLLVHAAPSRLDVTVRGEDGGVLARGEKLERHEKGPMSFLVRQDQEITLQDGWPTEQDLGRVVILPGGEAGTLQKWWNAENKREWRWEVEFYNHT
jgi:hypothetical protein